MISVLTNTWPLLTGIMLLMVGNGVQGTLIGIRGVQEGFSTYSMSYIMAGYFVGVMVGSRITSHLIKRVGHVRVFAALGSLISASLIIFAEFTTVEIWIALRFIVGFCFSGVYVVAESWLNESSSNETRGQTLSAYIIVQMIGIISAQALLNIGDTKGYFLFILASVLVSISFTPILLSVSPSPLFVASEPMSIRRLLKASPLGAIGSFFLGAVFSALWGMTAVFGLLAGLDVTQISILVGCTYAGGLLLQYPVGWISDHIDRRFLILIASITCTGAAIMAGIFSHSYTMLLIAFFVMGASTNPLYALLIAYTNDFLAPQEMPSAAGGLLFLNGLGSIGGPMIVGWLMTTVSEKGFFIYIGGVMLLLTLFCIMRMTIRQLPEDYDTLSYTPISPTSTSVAIDMAQEVAIERMKEDISE